MSRAHAVLASSASHRWIHCPGSVALSKLCPDPGSTSYADEGTLAHSIGEAKILKAVGEISDKEYGDRFSACVESRNGEFWCGEMDEATTYYANYVLEKYNEAGPNAEIMVEQHFSLEPWVPDGFGTSDVVIIADDTIEVIDLKYGKGVKVDAKENSQLRLYGLGAAMLFGEIYDLNTVRTTIIQPRLDHISTEELPLQALFNWAEIVVKPAAQAALKENAPTSCGDWCRWCPAKAVCRTRADKQLELARYDFEDPPLLTNDEIAQILIEAEELQKWASDVQDYAFQQALAGEKFPGWKLVEGRSVRKYADDGKVADILQAAGYPEAALYERKLYGITAMEKIVGKKKLAEILGELIVKPAGKPVLVPITDKREAISTAESAKEDFADG